MGSFEPTPQQRRAMEDRGGSLLVSAAAGSGSMYPCSIRKGFKVSNAAESSVWMAPPRSIVTDPTL